MLWLKYHVDTVQKKDTNDVFATLFTAADFWHYSFVLYVSEVQQMQHDVKLGGDKDGKAG